MMIQTHQDAIDAITRFQQKHQVAHVARQALEQQQKAFNGVLQTGTEMLVPMLHYAIENKLTKSNIAIQPLQSVDVSAADYLSRSVGFKITAKNENALETLAALARELKEKNFPCQKTEVRQFPQTHLELHIKISDLIDAVKSVQPKQVTQEAPQNLRAPFDDPRRYGLGAY